MEILLLIIAGVVLYFLYNGFQDYMKNPYKREEQNNGYKTEYNVDENPYIQETPEDKVKKTEFGVLTRILQCITHSDGNICKLEKELVSNMLDDIAMELSDFKDARNILQNIFDNNKDNLDDLAESFANLTKGEYKKRLKVIEFLFALAYADGNLDEDEREKIIDVAAIFELNNDDFNKIYDDFENEYATNVAMDSKRAMEILGLDENYTLSDLENVHTKKIKDSKQNILLNKNLNKNFKDTSLPVLRDIDEAYKVLLSKLNDNINDNETTKEIKDS
ncbi:hypothetical protein CCY99_06405 [Helicobacter sp. 16-1353]|uniref:tellurite resistance TerB family protein n=1 Tax=Helicobacter sp. 16-1353 TaxID=2004996 RepID=UPI000DCB636C|nr:TerB family tellurite resistance protein [Helicobacter sp. 16-1353]RAX52996.1 hypothetical protein CCY99_06405 [Helicobacter sp. 16-1353]